MSLRWRGVDHVAEARREARPAREEVPKPKGIFTESSKGGSYKPRAGKAGERFGDLVIKSIVGTCSHGNIWLCACDCGGQASRTIASLNRAVRKGSRSSCAVCNAELRRAVVGYERELVQAAFRKQWVDYGSLWLEHQTRALTTQIQNDLLAAFGPVQEEEEAPKSFTIDPTWPFGADDVTYARAGLERWRSCCDQDDSYEYSPDVPVELSAEENRALQSICGPEEEEEEEEEDAYDNAATAAAATAATAATATLAKMAEQQRKIDEAIASLRALLGTPPKSKWAIINAFRNITLKGSGQE